MTEVGIGLPGRSIGDVRSAAEAAAAYPFDSFSVYGDLGDLPPYAALHASADLLKGSKVRRVGPMGVPAGLQHPEIIRMHAKALEEQLPGQSYVGLVRGAFLSAINERPASLEQLEKVVQEVRSSMDTQEIPIRIGGFGPTLLREAGRLAVEGVKLGGSTNPLLAEKAQESISNSKVKIILGAVSVIDANRQAARQLARQEVAKYLDVVGRLDVTLDQDEAESLREFMDLFRVGDKSAGSRISDSLLDKFAFAGTPGDILERLEEMDGRVDVFEFGTPHGLGTRAEAIHYIGQEIMQERRQS